MSYRIVADSTTPQQRRAARHQTPSRPVDSEIYRARKEAVLIVREGLEPYMRARRLQMPPPTMPLTLSDLLRDLTAGFHRAAATLRRAHRPSQSDFTLAAPATEGDS